MWQAVHCLSIRAIQADALFVSELQRSKEPSCGQVRQAVVAAIRRSAAQAGPSGWRRSLAIIRRQR